MKKFLALLLAMLMLFTCACGGGSNKPGQSDKYDAVKPLNDPVEKYIEDSGLGNLYLSHVDTGSYGDDAKVLLDLVEEYLGTQGISAKIKAMYSIAFGLAGNFDDVIVVKVEFEDESVLPIYIEILHDFRKYTAGYSVMGSFRDSDVSNKDYFNKALSIMEAYDKKLSADLGFLRDDVFVGFSIRMTRDLSFHMPDANDELLRGNTMAVYNKFTLASWYDTLDEPKELDGFWVQRINDPNITSLDSLNTFLQSAFTQRVAKEIMDAFPYLVSGDYPVYIEKDGSLYIQPIGMGGPEDLLDAKVKYVAQQGDSREFMIIEATRCDRDDNFEPINIRYTEHLYVFEKQSDGTWRCDHYDDYVFGRYESSIETQ